jgi:hypothetical protein
VGITVAKHCSVYYHGQPNFLWEDEMIISAKVGDSWRMMLWLHNI